MTLIDDSSTVLDVDYLYYANGWLKEVQENSSSIAQYTYDEVGNRKRIDLGNGTYTTYNHAPDPRYFVSEIDHYDPADQLMGAIVYSDRDQSGNPTSVTYPSGTVGYTYDANNRLDSATGFDYNYDWVGNRLNPPASPNPMVYDATDKLVTWPGMQSFTYYSTGSLHQQKNTGGTVQKTWAYTGAELISSVTHNSVQGSPSSSMAWDADSNRVSFTSSTGGTTEFAYDATAGIPAVIEEETPNGSVYYIREPDGSLIARGILSGGTFAAQNYYHFDELGSTRFLTNGSGTVTDTYTYDAWGKQTAHTGSTAQPYRYVGQLGYYSHYQDSNLFSQNGYQFLQLGVRFYDVLTGRFTQRDAIRGMGSAYAYVSDRPTLLDDATGMYPGCNKQQNKDIDAALKKICDALKSGKCTCPDSRWSGADAQCYLKFCENPHIQCKPQKAFECGAGYCGRSGSPCKPGRSTPGATITLCPLTWNSKGCDSGPDTPGHPVMASLLHELNHLCGDCSEQHNEDRMNSCLKEIFGK